MSKFTGQVKVTTFHDVKVSEASLRAAIAK